MEIIKFEKQDDFFVFSYFLNLNDMKNKIIFINNKRVDYDYKIVANKQNTLRCYDNDIKHRFLYYNHYNDNKSYEFIIAINHPNHKYLGKVILILDIHSENSTYMKYKIYNLVYLLSKKNIKFYIIDSFEDSFKDCHCLKIYLNENINKFIIPKDLIKIIIKYI